VRRALVATLPVRSLARDPSLIAIGELVRAGDRRRGGCAALVPVVDPRAD
jgi:hypothetical protein